MRAVALGAVALLISMFPLVTHADTLKSGPSPTLSEVLAPEDPAYQLITSTSGIQFELPADWYLKDQVVTSPATEFAEFAGSSGTMDLFTDASTPPLGGAANFIGLMLDSAVRDDRQKFLNVRLKIGPLVGSGGSSNADADGLVELRYTDDDGTDRSALHVRLMKGGTFYELDYVTPGNPEDGSPRLRKWMMVSPGSGNGYAMTIGGQP